MKTRLSYITAILLAGVLAAGCTKKEEAFQIQGEPRFSMDVIETQGTDDVVLATLDESAQYELALSADAYSAAAKAEDHVRKATRFHIKSNLQWKVVPVDGEDYNWINPFPGSGEKDGIFFFKTSRHISQAQIRKAYFNILVDKGNGFEPLEGMLVVTQDKSDDFLEVSSAIFNIGAEAQTIKLRVYSNVDWTYSLSPMEQYATADTDWITETSAHEASKQIDTLIFQVAENLLGVRGASIVLDYTLGAETKKMEIPVTQYPAEEIELDGFPVRWVVQNADNTYSQTWLANGTIPPVTGAGYIQFNNDCGKAADVNSKVLLDFDKTTPRATGVWPGDYCAFVATSPVSAGTIVKLSFTTRVSATGHKYWRLEFRDGEEWKIAGTPLTDEEVMGPDGLPVIYTHAMNADGATNIDVESVVKFTQNTDQVEFRFICAANWQANGKGALAAPNGGTWRVCVGPKNADFDPSDEHNPQISIIAAGSEVLIPAQLSVSPEYLVFPGLEPSAKTIVVSCNNDFTLSTSQSWIHLEKTEYEAGENINITVTCDESSSPDNREGSITVKSGITRKDVAVIQGAAGQNLDPFIALSEGESSYTVTCSSGSKHIVLYTNVPVSTECSADWVSITPDETVKGLVEKLGYTIAFQENKSLDSRNAEVRMFNSEAGVQLAINLTQEAFSPVLTSAGEYGTVNVTWEEGSCAIALKRNIDVSTEVTGDWITLTNTTENPENEVWTYTVSYADNTDAAPRSGSVRFFNEAYGKEFILHVEQQENNYNTTVKWGFSADLMASYADSFTADNAFKANISGTGTLSWINSPEGIAADVNGKKSRKIGGTGQPYVEGAWPGDYWEFKFPLRNVAAGEKIAFNALERSSATGHKYWRMEYSLDGNNFTPVKELQTETETGTSAQYTHLAPSSDNNIMEIVTLTEAVEKGTMYIRFICAANWQNNGKGALSEPNAGTHRWSGAEANGPTVVIGYVETEPDPDPEVVSFPVEWSFAVPSVGESSLVWPNIFIKSDDGAARLDMIRPGDRSAPQGVTYSDEGNFNRLLVKGVYKGDYWLFTIPVKDQPAGRYRLTYSTTSSSAGPKYFRLEYSLGNDSWYAVNTKTETVTPTSSGDPREVTYTYAIPGNNVTYDVDEFMDAPAISGAKTIYVRAIVADDTKCDGTTKMASAEHGGTHRIGKKILISFTPAN